MFYYHTLKELEDLVNENKLEVWQVVENNQKIIDLNITLDDFGEAPLE